MSGMKRMMDAIRDAGTDAYYEGKLRMAPYNTNDGTDEGACAKENLWLEGWDFGQDMDHMNTLNAQKIEEQIADMNGYWEDFYAGEQVTGH